MKMRSGLTCRLISRPPAGSAVSPFQTSVLHSLNLRVRHRVTKKWKELASKNKELLLSK